MMTIPDTMRASVLYSARTIGVEERLTPTPGQGQVLVKIASVGACGSDAHYYHHGRIGGYVVEGPLILGHEAAGRIEAVGEGVDASWIGKRVSLEPGVPCARCTECRTGHYNLCPDVVFFATPPVDGTFCEYIAHSVDYVYELPDNVSDDAGALIEPLSVGIWAMKQATVPLGGSVLITGAGPIGLMAVQVARASGVKDIIVADPAENRREAAVMFGATSVFDPTAEDASGLRVDTLVDCSGVASAIASATASVKPRGSVTLVGMGGDSVALPMSTIQNRELTVKGIFRYAHTWPTGISLATRGLVELDAMVTGHFSLDRVDEALTADPALGAIKSAVTPWS